MNIDNNHLKDPLLVKGDIEPQYIEEETEDSSKSLLQNIENLKSSTDFLEQCAYFIELNGLYKVVSTCYYHQGMTYAPVLLKINSNEIQQRYNAQYLLQVWKEDGKKIFEKKLQGEVTLWAVAYQYFVYRPSDKDQDHEYLHVIDLKDKNATYLVKDFTNADPNYKFMTFVNKKIYIANQQEIKAADVKLKDEFKDQKQDPESVFTVHIDPSISKIHGLFMTKYERNIRDKETKQVKVQRDKQVLVALESEDDQIDFNVLKFKGSTSINSETTYQLKQYREIIPRKNYGHRDYVVSFSTIIKTKKTDNIIVSVAKRESGQFDLYHSGQRVFSSTSEDPLVKHIDLTFENIYMSMKTDFFSPKEVKKRLGIKEEEGDQQEKEADEKPHLLDVDIKTEKGFQKKTRMRKLDLYWESDINYDHSELIKTFDIKTLFQWRLQSHFMHYNSYCLVGTSLAVAHGKIISMYNILTSSWRNFFFDNEIKQIFRDGPGAIIALLQDDSIRFLEHKKLAHTGEDQEPWEENKQIMVQIPEKLTDYHQDREDNKWIIFITKRGKNQSGIFCLYQHKLHDITDQFVNGFTGKPTIVFLFSVNEDTEFIVQHGNLIDLFTIEAEELKDEGELELEEKDEEEEDKDKKEDEEEGEEGVTKVVHKEEEKPKEYVPKVTSVKSIDVSEVSKKGKPKSAIKDRVVDGVKFQQREEKAGARPKFFLFLSDAINFYVIDMQTQKVNKLPNQNCQGLFFSDNNYLYTISQKGEGRTEGLRLYDIENVVLKQKDYSYLLTDQIQVTCQGLIDYSQENERITFLASFEKIGVTPLLHRNTMSYMGMKKRENYIATRAVDGKFVALSNKGKMYSWDLITGKLFLDTKANNYKQYKDYDIYYWNDADDGTEDGVYYKEWYSKILLMKKTPLPDQEKYAKADVVNTRKLQNQVLYNEKTEKIYYEFKLIEIVSDTTIVEHISFVHHVLPGCMQFIYFSEDLQHMYERQKYEKHYMYRRDESSAPLIWKEVHRFDQIPVDLLNITQYPYIFTPNFTRFLDVDESGKIIIRNTFKTDTMEPEQQTHKVPKQLANSKHNKIDDIMRRIRWVNEDYLHIINDEGIERIVDITQDFKEIEFNFIPLYDNSVAKQVHYILDFPSSRLNECFPCLRRRYQCYKSGQYIGKALNPNHDPYSDMFTVDYRIDNCNGQFETDMSFSFLHWSMIEQLRSGKLKVEEIDHGQIKLLFYNILPKGDTVLHKLHSQGKIIEQLLQIAHPNAEDRSIIKIHIPIVRNMKGNSSLHLHEESEEYRYINVLLEYLSAYDIDHHSRAIKEVYPCMIEHELPNFVPYLQSRIKQTQAAASLNKGMISDENDGICATSLWLSKDALDKLFKDAPIEQDVKLQFIDMPDLHSFTSEISHQFFKQLAASSDMKLFETTAVQKLIEFQWPLVLKFTIRRLFFPFVAFLILYMVYMHAVFGKNLDGEEVVTFADDGTNSTSTVYTDASTTTTDVFRYTSITLLIIAAGYLLGNEATQLYKQSYEYFFSIWNYLDIVPPVMILVFITLDFVKFFDENNHIEIKASMQAIMSLFIWLKFLYFLRIFEQTGYLIRIIIQVVIDMRFFLFVLLLTFVAFGDAIYNISNSNPEPLYDGGTFVGGILYVYRIVLGDFDTTEFGTVAVPLMWTLWLLCTVFNMIIMLNLLIAIISESFANINSVAQQASYQEKASIISENIYLIPDRAKNGYCPDNSYILMAIDTQLEQENEQESLDAKLRHNRKKLREHSDKLFEKLGKRIKKLNDNVAKVAGLPAGGSLSFDGKSMVGRQTSIV